MMGHAPQAGAGATAAARVLTINLQATLLQTNPGGGTREPAEMRTMAKRGATPTNMAELLSAGPRSRSPHLPTAPTLAT